MCCHTCASIPERGISKVREFMIKYLKDSKGTTYCLKIDIRKFYPHINQDILKAMLRKKIKCKKTLELLDKIVDSSPHEIGIPIGSYLSQYLANYYLTYFDHFCKEKMHMKYVIRYMDDLVIMHHSKTQLSRWLTQMNQYLYKELKLEIKDNFQIFPVEARGVDFAGFRFYHNFILLRKSTALKYEKSIINIMIKVKNGGKLNYSNWCSCNSYRGWLLMCNGYNLYRTFLKPLEIMIALYYVENIYYKKLRKRQKRIFNMAIPMVIERKPIISIGGNN
jgi:hypothetical protein